MKTKIFFLVAVLFAVNLSTAQVLFSEDFDSLPPGALSTDPTGATPGQNGWYVIENFSGTQVVVEAEPGKGNVARIKPNATAKTGDKISGDLVQKDISALWNNRNPGNDILHLKMEYYFAAGNSSAIGSSIAFTGIDGKDDNSFFYIIYQVSDVIYSTYRQSDVSYGIGKFYYNTIVINTWISLEVFVDYNTGTMYLYIPSLNIIEGYPFSHNSFPYKFSIGHRQEYFSTPDIGGKYDNIRISALPALPAYLGVDDFVSSKFNVFPNPVTDFITITNSENIGIKEVLMYDINGKTVKSQKLFHKESEVQLPIEDLSAGTYFLHIRTNEGTAIKKIIKK